MLTLLRYKHAFSLPAISRRFHYWHAAYADDAVFRRLYFSYHMLPRWFRFSLADAATQHYMRAQKHMRSA